MFGLSTIVLAKLAAPALVVALSPIPIVVALLLLVHNDRPQSSSIAYVLGRLISLVGLTAGFMRVPRMLDNLTGPAPRWIDGLVMAIGVLLVVFGARLWWRRTNVSDGGGWADRAGRITPVMSAAIGIFPMLASPKVLVASAAAGTEIATVRLTTIGAVAAVAYYAALASSTVAVPVLAYLVVGSRIDPHLERARHWIQGHHQTMTAIMLVVGGVAVTLYGFS